MGDILQEVLIDPNYRICKNKHGYYKAQKLIQRKILGIIPLKPKWTDVGYRGMTLTISKDKKDIERTIQEMIALDEKNTEQWTPEGEIICGK